jgi:uncharacterized SAM-binding protein YcdF (DUF218 family)
LRKAVVIFGAPVLPDGAPTPALARRIGFGLQAATEHSGPVFCSGAAGETGRSEAEAIAEGLRAGGVHHSRIILDEGSRDTLETAVAAARFARREKITTLVICTEDFHMARARMLIEALGLPTERGPVPLGPSGAPADYYRRMKLREAAAYGYDYAVVRWRRRSLLSGMDGDWSVRAPPIRPARRHDLAPPMEGGT